MKLPPLRICRTIRKLHERFLRAENEHVAANARQKIEAKLAKHGLKWEDLDAVLKKADKADRPPPSELNVLNITNWLISRYAWIPDEERLAVSLWVLHTHVYDNYNFTPRLALLSPVFGCGKTTLLILIQQLVDKPKRYINVSAALVYRLISSLTVRTLLLDEGDNLGLLQDRVLRSVLNGNRRSDNLGRASGKEGETKDYRAFTPIAIAAVGKLPNALTQRSIIINMQRYPANAQPLERLNEDDLEFRKQVFVLQEEIRKWKNTNQFLLNPNPENPVKNRYADNWRPLLAIADSLGRGDEAREAALKLTAGLPDEDPKVQLLMDIRDIFDALGVDRIFSKDLLRKLHEIEDGMWLEWTGPNGDQQPHKSTANEMARMLRDFKIKSRTVSPLGSRQDRGPSAQGYFRKDFESAWASYCTPRAANAPTHQRTMRLIEGDKD
jgi:hypothetical protein